MAKLNYVFVFIMPKYFKVMLSRKAPDFNSFFVMNLQFVNNNQINERLEINQNTMQYSEAKKQLLEHYLSKYSSDFGDIKKTLDNIIQVLWLNTQVNILNIVEKKRLYIELSNLLEEKKDSFESRNKEVVKKLCKYIMLKENTKKH